MAYKLMLSQTETQIIVLLKEMSATLADKALSFDRLWFDTHPLYIIQKLNNVSKIRGNVKKHWQKLSIKPLH